MHNYVLLWLHGGKVDTYYFQSKMTNLNHLTFGGAKFAADWMEVDLGEPNSVNPFCLAHPGWRKVLALIEYFSIDFNPFTEQLMIDMVPDEISRSPSLERMGSE